jgi:predicted nucleic acid-binding protein
LEAEKAAAAIERAASAAIYEKKQAAYYRDRNMRDTAKRLLKAIEAKEKEERIAEKRAVHLHHKDLKTAREIKRKKAEMHDRLIWWGLILAGCVVIFSQPFYR